MNGYSDDINHAFAFAAKYRAPFAPAEGEMAFMAHPANVAVILARHGADEVTLVAGILHSVLEVTPRRALESVAAKIEDKFGISVLALAREAFETRETELGTPLTWLQRKHNVLLQVLVMSPRALDICCADEIHQCGTALATIERLGVEYLALNGFPSTAAELRAIDDILAALDRRIDWPPRGMKTELHSLRTRLATALAEAG